MVLTYVGGVLVVVIDVDVDVDVEELLSLGPKPAKISVSLNPVTVVLLSIGVNTVDNILRKGAPAASNPEA